jgi:hypothetical protein
LYGSAVTERNLFSIIYYYFFDICASFSRHCEPQHLHGFVRRGAKVAGASLIECLRRRVWRFPIVPCVLRIFSTFFFPFPTDPSTFPKCRRRKRSRRQRDQGSLRVRSWRSTRADPALGSSTRCRSTCCQPLPRLPLTAWHAVTRSIAIRRTGVVRIPRPCQSPPRRGWRRRRRRPGRKVGQGELRWVDRRPPRGHRVARRRRRWPQPILRGRTWRRS